MTKVLVPQLVEPGFLSPHLNSRASRTGGFSAPRVSSTPIPILPSIPFLPTQSMPPGSQPGTSAESPAAPPTSEQAIPPVQYCPLQVHRRMWRSRQREAGRCLGPPSTDAVSRLGNDMMAAGRGRTNLAARRNSRKVCLRIGWTRGRELRSCLASRLRCPTSRGSGHGAVDGRSLVGSQRPTPRTPYTRLSMRGMVLGLGRSSREVRVNTLVKCLGTGWRIWRSLALQCGRICRRILP